MFKIPTEVTVITISKYVPCPARKLSSQKLPGANFTDKSLSKDVFVPLDTPQDPKPPKTVSFSTCGDSKIQMKKIEKQLKQLIPGLVTTQDIVFTRTPGQSNPTQDLKVANKLLGTEFTFITPHEGCAGDSTPPIQKMNAFVTDYSKSLMNKPVSEKLAPHVIVGGVIDNHHQNLRIQRVVVMNGKEQLSSRQKEAIQALKSSLKLI